MAVTLSMLPSLSSFVAYTLPVTGLVTISERNILLPTTEPVLRILPPPRPRANRLSRLLVLIPVLTVVACGEELYKPVELIVLTAAGRCEYTVAVVGVATCEAGTLVA